MSREFDYPRDFKGIWLPKEIWLDDDLNAIDKIIFSEIYSLDVEDSDGCYASNEYLASFCKCSITKVSTSISRLIELGYIKVVKNDGRKRWLKASLSKFESQTNKNEKSESQEMKESNIPSNKYDKNNDKNSNINALENVKKSFSKGDMYAPVSGKQESAPEKQNRYIPPDYTEEQLREHIKPVVYSEIEQYVKDWGMAFSKDNAEEFIDIVCGFNKRYKERFRENHYVMPDKTIRSAVRRYLEPPEEMDGVFEAEKYEELMDKYFSTNFNQQGNYDGRITLSFSHFMSDTIRGHLANRCWN